MPPTLPLAAHMEEGETKKTAVTQKDTGMRGALFLFMKVSGWIAFPVVIALLLGKWLDRKFDTAPFLFLGLTALAFLVSMFGIVKETKKELKKIEKNAPPQDHGSK